ncbi:MAG TPA: hypothetical protein VGP47_08460 [Parachlamydiaceae bacterium]|nr:hypothetical protein [Parachlamydiaceae bacterium]
MGIFSVNAVSAYGAAHIAHVNPMAAYAFQMPIIPPGNSLGECVDFVFSDKFRKYINASTVAPPLTTVGNINEYLSSCVCKIYNETFPPLKDIPSHVLKNIPINPIAPPQFKSVYSITNIPPIFQNISNYFFKVFIPYAENKPREPGVLGTGKNYGINFLQKFANTLIGIDLAHYYAQGSTPATNTLDASIYCSGDRVGSAAADIRAVDFVKDLCINYFKKMGASVYVNGKSI